MAAEDTKRVLRRIVFEQYIVMASSIPPTLSSRSARKAGRRYFIK